MGNWIMVAMIKDGGGAAGSAIKAAAKLLNCECVVAIYESGWSGRQ